MLFIGEAGDDGAGAENCALLDENKKMRDIPCDWTMKLVYICVLETNDGKI